MRTQDSAHDAFEQRVRKALDQYEVPYNSADWAHLEKTMSTGVRPAARVRWGIAAALLVGIVAGGAAWYMSTTAPETEELPVNVAVVADATAPAQVAKDAGATAVGTTLPASESAPAQAAGMAPGRPGTDGAAVAATLTNVKATRMQGAAKAGAGRQDAGAQAAAGNSGRSDAAVAPPTSASDKEQRTFRASVSQACAGTPIDFMVERMPENGIYLWNFGDGSFSNKANPEHTFSKPGRYQVMLSMSSAGGGFIQNKASSDVIVIHEAPKSAFNVVRQEYDGHLPSIHFENRSLGGIKYHWDFGDGQTSDIAHPDHIYKAQGTYRVELTVTNPIGCDDVLMKEVRIEKDYNLDAPAAFSPNGDGHEDTFMPEALLKLGVKFTLSIYDLNGNLIYETRDATLPWSGKLRNRGEACQPGEYAWVVDVRESLHLAETYTGKVRLVR